MGRPEHALAERARILDPIDVVPGIQSVHDLRLHPRAHRLLGVAVEARSQEPTSLTKMAIGCVLLGLGFVVMIVAAQGDGAPDARRSVLWLVGSTVVYTVGELYLSPIGLSFVTKVSPARIVSMMMGVWFLANFIGNYMTGYLGTFWEKIPHQSFFLLLMTIGSWRGWCCSRSAARSTRSWRRTTGRRRT
jgi:MFS family permease